MNCNSGLFTSLSSLSFILSDQWECINPWIHVSFTLLPLRSLVFIKSFILHLSFLSSFSMGVSFLPPISNESFCWGILSFSTVAVSSHRFLLSSICFPTVHFPLSLFLQPPSPPSMLFLFSSSTCVASRPQAAQLLSYIPCQSSPSTLFYFLPLSPMTINLASETSLHSSSRSVEVGLM